jgi:nucleotide-binding universal stress UspA family protein
MKGIRRILHPSDFSPASAAAFTRAAETAKASGAELLLVHVLSPVVPLVGDGYVSPQAYDDLQRAARAQGQKGLDALLAKAKKARVRATGLLLEGTAWDQIVRAAKSKRVDMIIMGTHGRSGLAKFFLGSVAERVIGTAPCPVLTVRGKR